MEIWSPSRWDQEPGTYIYCWTLESVLLLLYQVFIFAYFSSKIRRQSLKVHRTGRVQEGELGIWCLTLKSVVDDEGHQRQGHWWKVESDPWLAWTGPRAWLWAKHWWVSTAGENGKRACSDSPTSHVSWEETQGLPECGRGRDFMDYVVKPPAYTGE